MLFVIPVIACLVIQVSLPSFEQISRPRQRGIYWTCASIEVTCTFFAVYPDAHKGLALSALFAGTAIFMAFAYTPYLKIGGKIYSMTVLYSQSDPEDTDPTVADDPDYDPAPDSYSGVITATKTWWMMIIAMVIAAGNIYIFVAKDRSDPWAAIIGFGFLLFLSIGMGYGDASWDYPIARGQKLQFALASIVTAGAFTVLYLLAYYAGKRRPIRNKNSLEYRSHPRHQRQDGT